MSRTASNASESVTSHTVPMSTPQAAEVGNEHAVDLENGQAEKDHVESDPERVDWESEDDPSNPLNWIGSKKWSNVLVISLMSFSTPLASSMFAPAVPQAMRDLHSNSNSAETWVISVFILGFAIGPLVVGPLSEIYGRKVVYILSNSLFVIFTVACGLSTNVGMLIAFRFLAGCAGSTPQTPGGASIGEMFPKDGRGGVMALFGLGPLMGPTLGPVIGGSLSASKGWQWVFWLQSILSGVSLVLGSIFLRETYAVVILDQKTKRLIRDTENRNKVSALHDDLSPAERFRRAIIRPVKMLFFSPIVFLLSIYVAVVFGYLYVFVTTLPEVFGGQYGFSTGATGLTYLGLGVGNLVGLLAIGKTGDLLYRKLRAKNEGVPKPEFRLPPLSITAPLIAIAFFWYGWSAQAKVHWVVPIIGTAFFGIGLIPAFMSINLFLVEAYGMHAASAIAATRIFQSIGGAVLPLAELKAPLVYFFGPTCPQRLRLSHFFAFFFCLSQALRRYLFNQFDFSSYWIRDPAAAKQLLQGYIIMSTFVASQSAPFSAFGFLPQAIRFAQMLRLHVDPGGDNAIEADVRRMIWWHLVYLEVESTIASGLPAIIRADEYTTSFPSFFVDSTEVSQVGQESFSIIYSSLRPPMLAVQIPQHDELMQFKTYTESLLRYLSKVANDDAEFEWVETFLKMQDDRAYCMLGLRNWQLDEFKETGCQSEVVNTARSFLTHYVHLSTLSSYPQFRWHVPGIVQPLHALIILLLHLSTCSDIAYEGEETRNLVITVFTVWIRWLQEGRLIPAKAMIKRLANPQSFNPRYSTLIVLWERVWRRCGWAANVYDLIQEPATVKLRQDGVVAENKAADEMSTTPNAHKSPMLNKRCAPSDVKYNFMDTERDAAYETVWDGIMDGFNENLSDLLDWPT
ncbi:hypothetical protein MMC13_006276 [Lambiella insularis]|nr:hypothetical protein [Lambiella insularis]